MSLDWGPSWLNQACAQLLRLANCGMHEALEVHRWWRTSHAALLYLSQPGPTLTHHLAAQEADDHRRKAHGDQLRSTEPPSTSTTRSPTSQRLWTSLGHPQLLR